MAQKAKPALLDVFLSYKREEKGVAQVLAEFLTERGYDVWWDAALLAGDDFAAIVHEEVREARAVVVLWSRLAINSHWVQAEAALALAGGTLINAIIDDLPFDEIPPEYRHIQAVRLEADQDAFFSAIAAAIERKGTRPSQSTQSSTAARTALKRKVSQSQFFLAISQSSDPLDFKEYLERYGEAGQFAAIARRKITALEHEAADRRKLSRRVWIGLAGLATIVTIVSGLIAIKDDLFPPAPNPGNGGTTVGGGGGTTTTNGGTPDRPESITVNDADASYETADQSASIAKVYWGANPVLSGGDVFATVDFSELGTAFSLTIPGPSESFAARAAADWANLTLTVAKSGNTPPPDGITGVATSGLMGMQQQLIGSSFAGEAGALGFAIDRAGNRAAGNFGNLGSIEALVINLDFGEGNTGTLRLALPEQMRGALQSALDGSKPPSVNSTKDLYLSPATSNSTTQ